MWSLEKQPLHDDMTFKCERLTEERQSGGRGRKCETHLRATLRMLFCAQDGRSV